MRSVSPDSGRPCALLNRRQLLQGCHDDTPAFHTLYIAIVTALGLTDIKQRILPRANGQSFSGSSRLELYTGLIRLATFSSSITDSKVACSCCKSGLSKSVTAASMSCLSNCMTGVYRCEGCHPQQHCVHM